LADSVCDSVLTALSANEETRRDGRALERETLRLVEVNERYEAAIRELADRIDSLEASVEQSATVTQVDALEDRLASQEESTSAIFRDVGNHAATMATLSTKGEVEELKATIQADRSKMHSEFAGLAAVQALGTQVNVQENWISAISKDVGDHTTALATLSTKRELEELKATVQTDRCRMNSQFAGLAQVGALQSQLDSRSAVIAKLDDDFESFRREFQDIQSWTTFLRFSFASQLANGCMNQYMIRGSLKELSFLTPSLSGDGAIAVLRNRSSQFAPKCILRQSSADLFNLLDPESADSKGTSDSGHAWILIEFADPVAISEIQMQTGSAKFPRSFDLVVTGSDGKSERKEIRNADLNGERKTARFELGQSLVRSVKIEQKGPNYQGSQYLSFKALEFFSNSGKYKSGLFRSLFLEHRDEIREFVCVTARDFDLSDVHSISPRTNVCTFAGTREWVEIDFLDHQLCVDSYRLKRGFNFVIRSWSLLGSNDRTVELEKWTILDSRSESSPGEFEQFHLFSGFGGPFRYYRLVNDGPRWDGRTSLNFRHIDLFGILFPVNCS
jgi:hypothetical protein